MISYNKLSGKLRYTENFWKIFKISKLNFLIFRHIDEVNKIKLALLQQEI